MTPEVPAEYLEGVLPDELRGAMAILVRIVIQKEREACCRAMCDPCRQGWPVERDDDGWTHKIPGFPNVFTGCDAAAIRARPSDCGQAQTRRLRIR